MSTYSDLALSAPSRTAALLPDDRFTLLGDLAGFEVRGSTLILDAGGPRLAVTFLTNDLASVRLAPTGDFRLAGHGADAAETPFSYAHADRDWEGIGTLAVRDFGDRLEVRAGVLTLVVRKNPVRLRFTLPDGRVLLDDTAGHGWASVEDEAAPGGTRTEVRCWKALDASTRFFGMGDKTFELDRRGRRLTFWNADTYAYAPEQDPIYKSIPFTLGLTRAADRDGATAWTGWGLFTDNTYRSTWDLGSEAPAEDWWFGSEDGELRYYVFAGPDLKTPLRRYCDLTGHKPMPALWSLGYHQSRWNYHDSGYVRWIAHEFRRRGLPLDCIHLDIGHMDGYRVFTFDDDAFGDIDRLNADLDELGVRSVVIVDPGVKVDPDYFAYQEGTRRRLFCENPDGTDFTDTVWPGDVHWPDFSKVEARRWWGETHRRYLDRGVTGFWNDMNEPAILGGRDFPPEVVFAYDDRRGEPTDHREAHNVYGLLMGKATWEGLRDVRPDERPFLLTRACFSGSQRYAAAWTGDNVSTWEHLRLSLQICQSLSASGMAFCGPDIGGFAGTPEGELFARWMQAAVGFPFMRTHYSHEASDEQEPWSFGDEVEAVSREAMVLRYQLLPYLYTSFAACTECAEPPMRACVLEHPGDARFHRGADFQFFLGSDLLMAPVVEAGARTREVHFPDVPGGWYAYESGERHAAGSTATVEAPLRVLPLFARAGSVVPTHPPTLHTREAVDTLHLRVYPGTGRSSSYHDDGISYAFEQGAAMHLHFDQATADGVTTIDVGREGSFDLPYRHFEWRVPTTALGGTPDVQADGRTLAVLDGDAFAGAEEGVYVADNAVHIRTRTDLSTLRVASA